ncbi:NADH dehydrogenase [ubiquinone] 1 alpha subcomplex subunit 5 [Harpegnathos saltator]|uniref:NADH dehydrogenase [ubiquinone] 1 alpha subcomplex subunit 5 n=1 Tax=Harpegnathos saltator TaxID=610380 RepID=E2C6X0_HARSA|nr:NADH dehydrogenase [ubiquinone] 1 alpha subcomplex subunit 5 [Harpegnathos saltator]EFN76324.1 NADH dehydrogenase [ubiquinone] 1 alpha subcomplex subunit 5 [Harpegnathos saltator]
MAGVLKKTTRLTGLAVCKTPHEDIIPIYNKLLKLLEKFPQDYTYRTETEKLVKNRLDIVQKNTNILTIEEKIGCGQFEEILIQAKSEVSLAQKMLEWKPWEKLIQEAPANQWTWPPHK